ncbi:hypothetical protein ACFYXV_23745 [Streptomyces sp. NPDC002181]|uniref:hypothetical protein n=1 Tax=unclassified Streptomyces TaxID=2593676 RepID=UPI0036492A86
MGTDIHGIIECRWDNWLDEDDRSWFEAIDLDHLYNGRSYMAFGALFGVRDTTLFRPLAPDRGLPPDVTRDARAAYEGWSVAHSGSWITWAELKAADWDTIALEETTWYDGNLDRIGRPTRRQAVRDEEWGPVWDVMRTLARLHGDEGVRLVVWFDC